ncbi:MAG TPA: threonine-phosphate decarboxylase CobD [Candidatus Bathyarchaeia archaeon]|nr:threonine-phosphate decarboxylase CobD [Candidatus Bathyarchaeia archaeon]
MKSASELARKDAQRLEPCVHGGEVWDIANETGLNVEDLVDFSSSINPLGPSPRALEAMKKSFDKLSLYPDSNSTTLREAIACHFGTISKNNVIVGNGSTELIYLFSQVFLKKGDIALVAAPSFGEYTNAIVKSGSKPKHLKLSRDFQIEPDVFKREMKGAKAVFLCNPNNPTSMLIPHETLLEIVEKAFEERVVVFLDEDFIEFVHDEKRHSLVSAMGKYPNVFVLRTFTKFYGLTGLRVGYGIADEETIEVFSRVKMPWNVNSLAQAAAVAALADEEHSRRTIEVVKAEKEFLSCELARIRGFRVFPADTNFIFLDVRQSGFTAPQLREKMIKHGILVRDCSSFTGLDAFYIRVAVGTRKENERLLDAFKKALNLVD